MTLKKVSFFGMLTVAVLLAGCSSANDKIQQEVKGEERKVEAIQLNVEPNVTFQTIESFGASGAWWSQDVGGWTEKDGDKAKRDVIAQLLFDSEEGIGLSSYRYNLGAGSAESNQSPRITDPWRQGESFEVAQGEYDWEKDQNAQYMLEQAVNYGVEDIYFFANSPLERLTKNGSAYGTEGIDNMSNLAPENYQVYCDYLFDVTEHFLEDGIPVKYLSPLNEPQWDWTGGQEGCHFTPEEMVEFAKVIYEEKQKRPALADVTLSVPELGEWNNSSIAYFEAMVADETFMSYYPTWDIHSYWSNKAQKKQTTEWLKEQNIDVELKMSEWTEMVNGRDESMDSAYNLATQIFEDLTILNVTDWQYWIAVSCYDYRDGLIYVDKTTHEITPTKRLWTLGNFSKFIRPGATRVQATAGEGLVETMAFVNQDATDEMVLVALNKGLSAKKLKIPEGYQLKAAHATAEEYDLKEVGKVGDEIVSLPKKGVVTLELTQSN